MCLFLTILAVFVFVTALILLLPVTLILKSENGQKPVLKVKILFFNLIKPKKRQKKQSKAAEKIKNALGFSVLEKQNLRNEIKENGIEKTVSGVLSLFSDILKTLLLVLKRIKIKKLYTKIVIGTDDAAVTALSYGSCSAAVYTAVGAIGSAVKIKDKGRNINIYCDFSKTECEFNFDFAVSVKILNLVAAAIRFARKRLKSKVAS